MTITAIYATREVSWRPSFYRGEQYDPDLGLYYLRARYYNPQTGRFLSRDPEDGNAKDPQSLHKYLYAGGDPVNRIDPHGRGALLEYAIIATFLIQEYEPEILKVAKMGCSLLEFVDKVLTYIDFIKAVKNGPTENGVGDLSYFFFQAELACKSL
jgi:RHS repeat-associated protein